MMSQMYVREAYDNCLSLTLTHHLSLSLSLDCQSTEESSRTQAQVSMLLTKGCDWPRPHRYSLQLCGRQLRNKREEQADY